jgi:hypothetical protein
MLPPPSASSAIDTSPSRAFLSRAGEHAQTLHERFFCYALTAHFGHWLQVGRRGRNARRWQVATGLIYGQVKKCYQRRKLVRVSQVMRLGTEAALTAALQKLGLSGRLNTAFIERVNLTVRNRLRALWTYAIHVCWTKTRDHSA